ncbi:LPS biosynthesis protein [Thermaurantimonas aggregans]|uniref:LPS biosynthesis protein n=1 Tax=Thermaurantimonas aggregans TaxID=2173829 RepID=A0A401XK26_9FLAO|nr:DegT/DnrJ/EryC1/StrS family aminotransferase [Thermaurantimonas aggregans]MCX8148598.1 DegT/DnrJ/EryC1/StrS family aminotransferase [Thermaurantimonas aggregans]GCD77334.1 LPS biosynthesis protein [Thermaurantimonas aggregans]
MKNSKLKIQYAKVFIGERERKHINDVLDSGWLTTAKKTLQFEEKFADYIGAKYACAVNSCTAALHLAVDALGIRPGDKVFIPSMTFTSTAEVVRYVGADPVFLDTEYRTNLITPEILEDAVKKYPDVRFLIIVHYGGQAADLTNIIDICNKNNIKIIEDAAHAFPTKHNGRYIGQFGLITCFSFYANKTITTGEGGMLVTDDESIYNRSKIMRLHGINRDIWDRFTSDKPSWEYDVVDAGFKYNLTDLAAAIGLGQLENAELFRKERQKIAEFYYKNLSDIDCIDLPITYGSFEDHAWHLFPIILNENAPISRNKFIELMSDNGIGTSVHYKPLHQMTYYKEKYNLKPDQFPNAEKTWRGNVSLPIYPFMTEDELEYISDVIHEIFGYF